MTENLTTLAKRLRPLIGAVSQSVTQQLLTGGEGPGIDVVDGRTIGIGGDSILLYHADGSPVSEFPFSGAGLSAAIAAAAAGDGIGLPDGVLTPSTETIYQAGTVLVSGSVLATSTTGVAINGLTPGTLYALDATGGPFYHSADLKLYGYAFQVSQDGSDFSTNSMGWMRDSMGDEFEDTMPAWGDYLVNLDGLHARLFFTAPASSIKFRVSNVYFADNSGSLDYVLREATIEAALTIPSGIEIFGQGKNSIIDGNLINEGILSNLQVTGTINGGGIIRLVSDSEGELFSEVIKSNVSTGSAPLNILSTTLNINLNADMLDGHHAESFADADHTHPTEIAYTTATLSAPPTQEELTSLLGAPADCVNKAFVVKDSSSNRIYWVASTGAVFVFMTLAIALSNPITPPVGDLNLPENAAWCWFSDPRAVYYNGKTYVGFITSAGVNMVATYDHATDVFGEPVTVRTGMGVDDHANLSLLIRDSDKRLMAFYSAHTGSGVYYKVSTNPEDASAWGDEVNLDPIINLDDYTYTMPVQLTGETNSPIYLFFRYRTASTLRPYWMYLKTSDEGANWGNRTSLLYLTPRWPYMKLAQNGTSRIDFLVSDGHPGDDDTVKIYHFYYSGGNYYKSDGTQIAAPPWTSLPLPFSVIYDASGGDGWIEDIAIDGSGNPVVLYTVYVDDASGTNRDYYYAHWTGSAWESHKIVDAGGQISAVNTEYVGGGAIDKGDVNTVYLSVETSGQWEIIKYVTADHGSTWTPTAITTSSTAKQIRPVVPLNRQSDLKVLWLSGTYTSYTDFNLSMQGSDQ